MSSSVSLTFAQVIVINCICERRQTAALAMFHSTQLTQSVVNLVWNPAECLCLDISGMLSIILCFLYIFFSIAQQVPPNPFVRDKCERLPQSRRKQSACSHFKLLQKGIKTVTLYTRRLKSQRHWQATGMHILTGGKVKERFFYGLRWCFSII